MIPGTWTKRELFYLFLLLFAIFSGSFRKWLLLPDFFNHGVLGIQLLLPWLFCLGFYPWNQSEIYRYLFFHWLILFLLAVFPESCGFFHSIFGFLLHGGFWTAMFVFLANKEKVDWGKFYPVCLLILCLETILAVFQYVLPPDHIINQYANMKAIGDIALIGESARVTGTFSYVSGMGSFILFMSFQLWLIRLRTNINPLLLFVHEVCLFILALLNGSRAIIFAFLILWIISIISGGWKRTFSRYSGLFLIFFLIIAPLFPDYGKILVQPLFDFGERVFSNAASGEQTSRMITPWKKVYGFSSEHEWLGYGLGCTYQGANEIWGTTSKILRFGYFEEEPERILIEGGWVLLVLKLVFILLFIALSPIPRGLSTILFVLIAGYFPIVSNTYNAFFFLWGIISLCDRYEQKNRISHA
jgi:hypothetical protein